MLEDSDPSDRPPPLHHHLTEILSLARSGDRSLGGLMAVILSLLRAVAVASGRQVSDGRRRRSGLNTAFDASCWAGGLVGAVPGLGSDS